MILGIGADLCDIRRVEAIWERFGVRFEHRLFTPLEREAAARRGGVVRGAFYAKRFAAKEACAKALGTGFGEGVLHREIGVINEPNGRPVLCLTGGALARLCSLTPLGMQAQIHVTMTDEYPYAFAQVMLCAGQN
jgi:holo-[acyl-carrier protein] synthase